MFIKLELAFWRMVIKCPIQYNIENLHFYIVMFNSLHKKFKILCLLYEISFSIKYIKRFKGLLLQFTPVFNWVYKN